MDRSESMRRKAERVPGLRSIRRPISWTETGADHSAEAREHTAEAPEPGITGPEFDLTYVRTGAGASDAESLPIVIIPGGPGLASAIPYELFRRQAAKRELDIIMVEHRGVGLSRRDLYGHDLPLEAMQVSLVVDDLAAVLAAEGVEQAIIVGSSYGSYIAQAFGAAHPGLVAGLLLDSPMLSVLDGKVVQEYARDLLFRGTIGDADTRLLAAKIHDLVDIGDVDELVLGRNVRILFEFAGSEVLDQYLNQLKLGRAKQTQALLARLGEGDTGEILPYYMEFDLVAQIYFRELEDFGSADGRIFDNAREFAPLRENYSEFAGEMYDLPGALPSFDFPVLVLSGDRDLRTPRPVAEEIAHLAPCSELITLPNQGHSALDTHANALLVAAEALATGRQAELAWQPGRFANLKKIGGPSSQVGRILAASLAVDRLLS